MRIIFLLTPLVGLLLLSITLNAVRKGKIFRRLNKRLEGLFFSRTKKFFPEVCSIIFITKIKRLPHFFTQLYIVWRILCATYLSYKESFFLEKWYFTLFLKSCFAKDKLYFSCHGTTNFTRAHYSLH